MERIIFLDRDGVINRFPGIGYYVTGWKEFHFIRGAKKAIALLTKAGCKILVVSNQGGVAKGLLSTRELASITKKMNQEVAAAGGKIDGVFYCEHDTAGRCQCKKPKTGLFKQALSGRKNLSESAFFMVGDTEIDIEAGKKMACQTVLVLSGRVSSRAVVKKFEFKPDIIKKDLLEAAHWILKRKL